MEENTKSRDHSTPSDTNTSKVVELTPDMEIPTHAGGRVVDLTQVLDESLPDSYSGKPHKSPAPKESPVNQTKKPIEPFAFEPTDIEAQISMAFEAVQSQQLEDIAGRTPAEPKGNQADKPTRLARTAEDDAAHDAETDQIAIFDTLPIMPVVDQDAASSDEPDPLKPEKTFKSSARPDENSGFEPPPFDDAMAQAVDDQDDIIELVTIVRPTETSATPHQTTAAPPDGLEDGVIELIDIVHTPGHGLKDLASEAPGDEDEDEDEDEEVIDLIHVVAPGETAAAEPPAIGAAETRTAPCSPVGSEAPEDHDPAGYHEQVLTLSEILGFSPEKKASSKEKRDDRRLPADGSVDSVSDARIETAVENVLRVKYAKLIEKAITAAVKDAVTKEMDTLRRSFANKSVRAD